MREVCLVGRWCILSFLCLAGYGTPLLAQTEPGTSPISQDISQLSSESIKAFSDLYEKEELDLQKQPSRHQTVQGGEGISPQKRLYMILLAILGGLVFLGVGLYVLLTYFLVRAANKFYEPRVGAWEEDEAEETSS